MVSSTLWVTGHRDSMCAMQTELIASDLASLSPSFSGSVCLHLHKHHCAVTSTRKGHSGRSSCWTACLPVPPQAAQGSPSPLGGPSLPGMCQGCWSPVVCEAQHLPVPVCSLAPILPVTREPFCVWSSQRPVFEQAATLAGPLVPFSA